MTFDEILAQIIEILQRQGRVSYSALKLTYDDYLNDLKDELLYVHPVRDDDGRGLIWTGDMASGQEVAAQLAQTTQPPAVQAQPSSQVAPLSPAPPPDAERRQLTVMFCDLVAPLDSPANSTQKTTGKWSVPTNKPARKSSNAMKDILPNCSGWSLGLLWVSPRP